MGHLGLGGSILPITSVASAVCARHIWRLVSCEYDKNRSHYTVCLKKNIPDIFSYNSRKHCRIFIIFGTHITEKLGNQ